VLGVLWAALPLIKRTLSEVSQFRMEFKGFGDGGLGSS
jgi:hypothetical protein